MTAVLRFVGSFASDLLIFQGMTLKLVASLGDEEKNDLGEKTNKRENIYRENPRVKTLVGQTLVGQVQLINFLIGLAQLIN